MESVTFTIHNGLTNPTSKGILIYVLPTGSCYIQGDVLHRWKFANPSLGGTFNARYTGDTALTAAKGGSQSPTKDVAPGQYWEASMGPNGGVVLTQEYPQVPPVTDAQIGMRNVITNVDLRAQWREAQKVIYVQNGINDGTLRIFERDPQLYFVVGADASTSDLSPGQIAAYATAAYRIPTYVTKVAVEWTRPGGADTLSFTPPSAS